jgi:mRNA-capping enzyme
MICAYLVEKLDFSIDAAIMCFARVRPPGIYKQDYINELFRRYASPEDEVIQVGERPDWDDKTADDDENDEQSESEPGAGEMSERKKRKRNKEVIKANPEFAAPIAGIEPLTELSYVSHIQRTAQEICKWQKYAVHIYACLANCSAKKIFSLERDFQEVNRFPWT